MKLYQIHLFYGMAVAVANNVDEVINLIINDEELSYSFTDIHGNAFSKESMLDNITEISGYEVNGPVDIIASYKEQYFYFTNSYHCDRWYGY